MNLTSLNRKPVRKKQVHICQCSAQSYKSPTFPPDIDPKVLSTIALVSAGVACWHQFLQRPGQGSSAALGLHTAYIQQNRVSTAKGA